MDGKTSDGLEKEEEIANLNRNLSEKEKELRLKRGGPCDPLIVQTKGKGDIYFGPGMAKKVINVIRYLLK